MTVHEYEFEMLRRSQRVDRFCDLLESAADNGEAFTITKDGKPVAVVIGIEEYEQLRSAATMYEAR